MDALGARIRVDSRGSEVMRVLPLIDDDINEEWISDKTRFACDGLRLQRLDTPYVRKDGKLEPASWDQAFDAIRAGLKDVPGTRVAAISGDLADCESMTALKDLMAALGSPNIDCRQDGARLDGASRAGYIFNTTIAGIEDADACLLVGANPRIESPVLNARLRKRYLAGGFRVGVVGPRAELTYDYEYLGAGPQTLQQIADGAHPFCEILKSAEKPMVIVGQGALARSDGAQVLAAARAIAEANGMTGGEWSGFNVLHIAAARVGGLDLGLLPGEGGRDVAGILDGAEAGDIAAIYLLGADEIDCGRLGKAFVIYQGHHGDAGASRADVVLPGAAYTEKNATYVNTEGRVQRTRLAVFPPGDAREDWTILRALSDRLGCTLPYDDLAALRRRMAEINPVFDEPGIVAPASWGAFGQAGSMDGAPFASPIGNFYMTDPISRASVTMAECTRVHHGAGAGKTGTDG